jgi:hypothetical protein
MGKLLLPIIVILLLISGVFIYNQNQINKQTSSETALGASNYEECMQAENGQFVDTYPKKCVTIDPDTKDKIVYIEQIKEPVNTSSWEKFNSGLGFSFLCPPYWECKKYDFQSASVYETQYVNISTFQLYIINSDNFQKSFLRHPDYKSPKSWFDDLLLKKPAALRVLPQTIKSIPGTDGLDQPFYYNYDFSNMSEIETPGGKELIITRENNDANVIVPLSNGNLVLVVISPTYLTQDPIFKAIFSSITDKF